MGMGMGTSAANNNEPLEGTLAHLAVMRAAPRNLDRSFHLTGVVAAQMDRTGGSEASPPPVATCKQKSEKKDGGRSIRNREAKGSHSCFLLISLNSPTPKPILFEEICATSGKRVIL